MSRQLLAIAACLALLSPALARKVPCSYVVEKGDSLYEIATKYELELEDIVKLNSATLENPEEIFPGDEVLLPCKPAKKGDSIADLLAHRPDTRIALKAAVAAGFGDTLSDESLVATAFIPNDEAFVALLETLGVTAEDLLNNTAVLTTVLSYHVVPEVAAEAGDLTDGQELVTLEDEPLVVNLKGTNPRVFTTSGQKVGIIETDLTAGKAIVHIVREVLFPVEKCEHIVEEGEYLYKIAEEYGLDLNALKKMNPQIEDYDSILPGDKVVVPCPAADEAEATAADEDEATATEEEADATATDVEEVAAAEGEEAAPAEGEEAAPAEGEM